MTDASGSDDDGVDQSDDAREDVVASLSESITALDVVDPEVAFDDLDPVADAVGDADVVGLGEASHGTREFFQWKHRFIRYLIAEEGLRLVGLEANFASCLAVNEYVLSGEKSAEEVLSAGDIHWPYRNESIRGLLEWLRAFNEGRPREDRVRFHGFDMQNPADAASRLDAYLDRVDPELLAAVGEALDHLASATGPDTSDDEMAARLDARETVVSRLEVAFEENEPEYVAATSRTEYERARRFVWLIEQGRKQFQAIHDGRAESGANVRIRDSAMAAQVQWLLDHESADQIVLWAHNAHLARDGFGGEMSGQAENIPSLGSNLAGLSSVDYDAVGLLLGGGTVRAAYYPEEELRACEIEPAPEGSVPDVFAQADPGQFFLDLRSVPEESPLGRWLASEPVQFSVAGGYAETPVNRLRPDLTARFDGVVFVKETTAARILDPPE